MEDKGKRSLSSRLLTSTGKSFKKRSVLGELLRSSVPAWVEQLQDSGLTEEEEKKLKDVSPECGLCACSLKGLKDLEPQNKKVCRQCKTVLCRQCTVQVHVRGHLRRRYVCFRCVCQAGISSGLVALPVAPPPPPATTAMTPQITSSNDNVFVSNGDLEEVHHEDEEEDGMLTTFVTKLWDTWSGFTGVGKQQQQQLDEDDLVEPAPPSSSLLAVSPSIAELSGNQQMENVQALLSTSDKFNGDMLQKLLLQSFVSSSETVLCLYFTDACKEIVKLMSGLGKAFEFAGGDMNDKLRIMDKRSADTSAELKIALEAVTLQQMVEREVVAKTTHLGKKFAGATRTVVRLLWFLDFIGVLLMKLGESPKTNLVTTIGATYDETLSPRHVWVLRRVVKSGLSMVPEKKVFLERLGVQTLSESEQCAKFKSWATTVDMVRRSMWKYMESKGLTEIP